MRFPQGQPVTVTTTVKDASGTLVTAGTIKLTVSKPDGTTQDYTNPTEPITGNYTQEVPPADLTQLGHYQFAWIATGTGAGVDIGSFDVFDPFAPAIISLQDAKLAANIALSTTVYDTELADMVATATSMMEQLTGGPIITRQVTETGVQISHFNTQLLLKYRPVVNVVSITDWQGVVVDTSDVLVDKQANGLYRRAGLPFLGTASVSTISPIRYDIVYTAGWGTSLPPAFTTAARIVVQHLWETQRGPALSPTLGGEETMPVQGMSYAMPYRAVEVLLPYLQEAYV